MKSWIAATAGIALMAATGVAVAQQAAPPPPPTETAPPPAGPDGERMGHHRGWMHRMMAERHGGPMGGPMGGMMGMPMPPQSPAAHFRFRRGDAVIDIKCADGETTKTCIDAGAALLDKLAALPK